MRSQVFSIVAKRANDLIQYPCAADEFADGAIIYNLSFQRSWIYVRGVRPDGRLVRSRYRYGQMVKVRQYPDD